MMPRIASNGLEFEVEEYGQKTDPPVLLIMGLAAQLTRWPKAFIDTLVNAGFRVIAFDNRDIGLSRKLNSARALSPLLVTLLDTIGLASLVAPYKLTDMAQDTVGLLDALGIERAHVIGASMGGMIGQIVCAEYPQRIKSFTAIMSSTNNPKMPKAHPAITKQILTARTRSGSREEVIENTLRIWNLIGSKDSGRDPAQFRQQVADSVDRNTSPAGIRRQIAAIIATRDIRAWTRKIKAPSLVIHGSDDPLVPVQCGHDIAANIDGASMQVIDGMGHDLPPKYQVVLTGYVLQHLQAVEKKVAASQAA